MNNSIWCAVHYTTADGQNIRLFNLQRLGAQHVERAQRRLGSHSFQLVQQPRNYSQEELDFTRRVRS